MRVILLLLHRWAGLAIAAFLVVSGLTGAIISWDHELDDLLNPHLTTVESQGTPLSSLELARRIEAGDPRARATFIPMVTEPGGLKGAVGPTAGGAAWPASASSVESGCLGINWAPPVLGV